MPTPTPDYLRVRDVEELKTAASILRALARDYRRHARTVATLAANDALSQLAHVLENQARQLDVVPRLIVPAPEPGEDAA